MFLIWFDNDRKRPLQAKVQAAVERYEERFGSAPALVLLNPAQAGVAETIAGIPVRTTPLVSRDHLYVGTEDPGERDALHSAAA
ncbi:MAG: hypothetical protein M3Y58_13020 [Chloroflexota bacterium]|nr:hypothetical protein [Chloroflexota bacterium]